MKLEESPNYLCSSPVTSMSTRTGTILSSSETPGLKAELPGHLFLLPVRFVKMFPVSALIIKSFSLRSSIDKFIA